jgi:hypothetical protein
MENKENKSRQPLIIHNAVKCKDCEKFIRDDEHLLSKEEFKAWLKESFKEEFGDYKNNSQQIRRHNLVINVHTVILVANTMILIFILTSKHFGL